MVTENTDISITGGDSFTGSSTDTIGGGIGESSEDVEGQASWGEQTVIGTITSFSTEIFPPGTECPEDDDDRQKKDQGDPEDVGGKEDTNNSSADDGCNPPECPTPTPCDLEPEDSPCVATVNVGVIFYGLKLFGQAIGTKTHMDQYCFNSDSAAQSFFDKMKDIDDGQSKPSLGDTQIVVNPLSLLLSTQGKCQDSNDPRPDAALIRFRQFETSLLQFIIPACDKDTESGGLRAPESDPCEPPGYL